MNITLFGGSFNPPTIAHQIVIRQAFELIAGIDRIWLLPDYRHSFAKNNTLAPAADRLALTRFLQNHRVTTQACCIDRKMSGNTIDHINYLIRQFPRHRFSFLMGSDNLKTFPLWPEWEKLLELMPFYIYPRAGYDPEPLSPGMILLTDPLQIISNISSTLVRKRMAQNLSWEHLVPAGVAGYIKRKRLFLPA